MTFLSCVDKDAGELKKEIKEIKTPLIRRFNSVSVAAKQPPKNVKVLAILRLPNICLNRSLYYTRFVAKTQKNRWL